MKRLFVLVVLLGAACVACGCAQLGPIYYKKSQDFSFHPPANWRYNLPQEEMTIFQSHSIRGYDFRPYLIIVVEDTDIETVEEYMEKQQEVLRELPGYEEVGQDSAMNFDAWRLIYDYFNPRYKLPLTAVCQLVVREGKVYAITYAAPKALWRRYKSMFYYSLDTFKFGEEAVPIGEYKSPYVKPELATTKEKK